MFYISSLSNSVRDQIVMVNGVSMENVYSTFTIQNLKSCGKTANIVSTDKLYVLFCLDLLFLTSS